MIPRLRDRHFYNHMAELTKAESYMEMFGGKDGKRTIAPLYGKVDRITTSENDPDRRRMLQQLYPDATIYADFREIPVVPGYDLVSVDVNVVMDGKLGVAQAFDYARAAALNGVIAYAPQNIEAYLEERDTDPATIADLLDQVDDFFGTAHPTIHDVARFFDGTIVCTRDAPNTVDQIPFVGLLL